MESQFEIRSTPNYKMIVENARKYGIGPRIPTVIVVSVCFVALAIFNSFMGIWEKMWRMMAIVAGVEVIVFFLPNILTFLGLRALRKKNGGELPEAVVTVSNQIVYQSGLEKTVYDFADLTNAVRLKYCYKLRFTERRSLLIDPSSFTKGTFEEFKQFLREKRPDLVIPE